MTFQIIGPDRLVFVAKDPEAASKFLSDFGLTRVAAEGVLERWETLNGCSIDLVAPDDATWPNILGTENSLRRVIYGVADAETLDALAIELGKDREIIRRADGSFDTVDAVGVPIGFQVTVRRELDLPPEPVNITGAAPQRPVNHTGHRDDFAPSPRTLSHFAMFVPDVEVAEAFYVERLGFRCNDRLGGGPFLRPAGTREHHTMFLIKTPPFLKGIEHVAFHLGGVGEVLQAGQRFLKLGYAPFWGPGRHQMGGNWFWYFNTPLGNNFEYDADMDLHDDNWVPREMPLHVDNAQAFLFQPRENWAPFAGPPPGAGKPEAAH